VKKILIIDDESAIRTMLKEYLEMEDYLVFTAASAASALEQIAYSPDLILLDINMPETDGYELCEKIRGYVSCPILFLTARTEECDRVKGFACGADDYIVKPFGMDELIARIGAHLRREERKQKQYSIRLTDCLAVDFAAKRVLYDGTDIGLTKTEYMITELLVSHPGNVFDKEQIYEKVRGFEGEADASIITEHIRRIRKKLKAVSEKNFIETVWGVGYRWIG